MRASKIIFYIILCLSTVQEMLLVNAKNLTDSRKTVEKFEKSFNIFPGLKLSLTRDGFSVNLRFIDLLTGDDAKDLKSAKKFDLKNIMKKIGPMMMTLPLVMQILRLPSDLAEIKVSLIRSIVVAKMALVMIIFNAIRNSRMSPTVIVKQPEVHTHYYNDFHQPEDDEEGWIG